MTDLAAFRQGLQTLGWAEGKNVQFRVLYANGSLKRLSGLAIDLVDFAPDVILAITPPAVAALRHVTESFPIVFVRVTDPVSQGFVAGLARPGGNITGFASNDYSMGTKWLQLLKEIAPHITRVGVVFNPHNMDSRLWLPAIEPAAKSAGLAQIALPLQSVDDLQRIVYLNRKMDTGLIVLPNFFADAHRDQIVKVVAQRQVPAIYALEEYTANGGLMSYSPDFVELFRDSATYASRILNGAKPADLPIQNPTKFKLVINLNTAKANGLSVSQSLLIAADKLIK
jgi:putative ABC transport system substrate-binding protein